MPPFLAWVMTWESSCFFPPCQREKLRRQRTASTCVNRRFGVPCRRKPYSTIPRVRLGVRRGFFGRGRPFSRAVAGLAEDLPPLERLERDLSRGAALGARDVVTGPFGASARRALGSARLSWAGCRARRSLPVLRGRRGARGGRWPALRSGRVPQRPIRSEPSGPREPVPLKRPLAAVAPARAGPPPSAAVPARRAARRIPAPPFPSVARSVRPAAAVTAPVRRRAPRCCLGFPAPRGALGRAAAPLSTRPPPLRRAAGLPARLAALRRRREPPLRVKLLLRRAEREDVAALGAGDLLVSSSGALSWGDAAVREGSTAR